MVAERENYLKNICDLLERQWPENRTVNIVCHGHSVPAGYRSTPYVDSVHSYPHLLYQHIKEEFPYAVVNVIVTAIGGENSRQGEQRFKEQVLCHRPDVLTLDYGLNDRSIGLLEAEKAWRSMICAALEREIKIILLTPSWEESYFVRGEEWRQLQLHAEQIRRLAEEYEVGLADTFREYECYVEQGGAARELLSYVNHPSDLGHRIIAGELAKWFAPRGGMA